MTDKEYFPLDVLDDAISKEGDKTSTTIKIEDASTETARVLVPQMGSDREKLEEGKIDVRRFTHLDPIDPYWMSFFDQIPDEQGGQWAKKFVEDYANYSYSVHGRHKELVVNMQKAVSGRETKPKDKKKRSFSDRLLGRNKDE